MRHLVAKMVFSIVGRTGLPHLPNDLQPALSEAAQGIRMALAALTVSIVVDTGPWAFGPALVSEKMD